MKKPKIVIDPEFGPIEVPPPPSKEEFDRVGREILAAMVSRRAWPAGSVGPCPECKKKTFIGRDDLEHRRARGGGFVVFRHLRGAKCDSCGAQSLEWEDMISVEEEVGVGITGDYLAKVCTIGSGSLGTYWPKDVVRNLRLDTKREAVIQIVDSDTLLVSFRRVPEGVVARDPGHRKKGWRRKSARRSSRTSQR